MAGLYFSDRERGPVPRNELVIDTPMWGGIVSLTTSLISSGAFAHSFPIKCDDGDAVVATDARSMGLRACAEIPGLAWPLDAQRVPDTLVALDFVEFCWLHVARVLPREYHDYYRHHHLEFQGKRGRRSYQMAINRLFARNGLVYEIDDSGSVVRTDPPVLAESLSRSFVATGDAKLDELLQDARAKFLSPDPKERMEALRTLWDAYERVKSLEDSSDKKMSTRLLIEAAVSEPVFREVVESEAKTLSGVGNTFHIRHSETSQIELDSPHAVDYLFHRLFALIWLLLSARTAE